MSKPQTKKLPIRNFAIFIAVFLVIGMVLGPNINQVYSGISATGSDTVELTNNGNLDTKVRDFSLSSVSKWVVNGDELEKRKSLTGTHSGVLTGYLSKITVIYESEMQSDFDDIRFATDSGVHVSYWIESQTDGSIADVWIKCGVSDGSTLVWMYYGNDELASGSDYDTIKETGFAAAGTESASGYFSASYLPEYTNDDDLDTGWISLQYDDPAWVEIDFGEYKNVVNVNVYKLTDGSSNAYPYYWWIEYWDGSDWQHTSMDDEYFSEVVTPAIWYNTQIDSVRTQKIRWYVGSVAQWVGFSEIEINGFTSTAVEPTWTVGAEQALDCIDPGISVGDDKLYYDDTLSSSFTYSDGSAYIDSSDVSASIKGSLPIIKVGTTQNIKIDHDLQYRITYVPKNMDVTSPDVFHAGEDIRVDTRLTDTSGNPISYQPLEMRARLFDSNDKQYLDEIISSTCFVIPGKYLHDNKHYQLRLSYEGYEFGGWSNEILADFDIGTEGFTITSSPDKAPESVMAASFAAVSGLVGMAVTGWLDVPIIGDIIRFIANLVGVEL